MQPPGLAPISWSADPSLREIEEHGGVVAQHADSHMVLDDFFLVSGYIPRTTEYETGLKGGVRFDHLMEEWELLTGVTAKGCLTNS